METARPENEQQVSELVKWAVAGGTALSVHGAKTKQRFGMAVAAGCEVSMTAFNGIVAYEPSELVMTAKPGTPLAMIEEELCGHRQQLAFEPPRLSSLFGADPGRETIGGAFLGNLSGPRRYAAGAARDHLLGMRAINGRGIPWKSGGRVIKNVTGYDLSRLLAGSWGTLSIVTELTFKVVPAPGHALTLCVAGLDVAPGLRLLRLVAGSPLVATGLAYLPCPVLHRLPVARLSGAGAPLTVMRLEGSGASVLERARALRQMLPQGPAHMELEHEDSLLLWKALRDVTPLTGNDPDHCIFKISLPPASAAGLIELFSVYGSCRWYADAVGAWIWLSASTADSDELWAGIRKHLSHSGGNAVIWRAPDPLKQRLGVFSGSDGPLTELSRRVKQSFDPSNVLNPGRLFAIETLPLPPAGEGRGEGNRR